MLQDPPNLFIRAIISRVYRRSCADEGVELGYGRLHLIARSLVYDCNVPKTGRLRSDNYNFPTTSRVRVDDASRKRYILQYFYVSYAEMKLLVHILAVQTIDLCRLEELGHVRVGDVHALKVYRALLLRLDQFWLRAQVVHRSRRWLDALSAQSFVEINIVLGNFHLVEGRHEFAVDFNLVLWLLSKQNLLLCLRIRQ